MKSVPKLVLKREALATLVSDELVAVAGAAPSMLGCTYTCQCSAGVTSCVTYTATNRCTQYCDA